MIKKKKLSKAIIAAVFLAVLATAAFIILYYNGFSGLRKNPVPNENQIRVACVGDSITYGHGIQNWRENNYPVQLGRILGDSYCVANFGVSGSTAQDSGDKPYRKQKMYKESLAFDADIIIIMLGSNDSKAENRNDIQSFKKQYLSLIKSYTENNKNAKIILCSPAQPFYVGGETDGPAKFGINPEAVSQISDAVKEIADENNFVYADINAFTTENSRWFSKDGVHPDANGAKAIADYLSGTIENIDIPSEITEPEL